MNGPDDATELFNVYNHTSRELQFIAEIPSDLMTWPDKLRAAVLWAVENKSSLVGAYLPGADLSSIDLGYVDLSSADLTNCDLSNANCYHADFIRANLTGADLTKCDLTCANLNDCNLTDCDMTKADLTESSFTKANLTRADLTGAEMFQADFIGSNIHQAALRPIRADLYDVLVGARAEAPAFLAALRAGEVDGSAYMGQCACLVGTIARVRNVNYETIEHDTERPIERFILGIEEGNTPETNPIAALVAEWTEAFIGGAA